jgi:hypothetical protein
MRAGRNSELGRGGQLRQSPRNVIREPRFLDLHRVAAAWRTVWVLQGEEQDLIDHVGGICGRAGADGCAGCVSTGVRAGVGEHHHGRAVGGLRHPSGKNEKILTHRLDAGVDDSGAGVAESEISLSRPRPGAWNRTGSFQFSRHPEKIPRKYVARLKCDS